MSLQRKQIRNRTFAGLSVLVLSFTLAACGGGGAQSSADDTSSFRELPTATRSATVVAQPPNTEGRLLASNCFQCHGTLGLGGFDKIRGSEANEVLEFMTKTASKDIMAAHAQGYTTEQLKKIIAYLQQ
jgi:mono/diheme cytochrome c family protein